MGRNRQPERSIPEKSAIYATAEVRTQVDEKTMKDFFHTAVKTKRPGKNDLPGRL